ncbi:DUF5719 family protein [Streptomyces paludis]|uniref:Secreted protein n=1 Tax=Streptomyces paludis TaxID=2282738 RepID=A0A345HN99_9ACTN|nr:DUF5719 family protein [Streptomyces paludis]AXG78173.1 hypothetical protein DVK44_11170 [Streptomyces paludis]
MNRTTLSLLAVATALAAITGFASMTAPAAGDTAAPATAARLPVERTSQLCPVPSVSDVAETTYTSVTPTGKGGADREASAEGDASAELKVSTVTLIANDGKQESTTKKDTSDTKAFLALKEPGKPVTAEKNGADAPALVGVATGRFAPGWTTQQTTTVGVGDARGLLGLTCTPPETDFWFPAASTERSRQDYVHLTNPDDSVAVVDIELYGKEGLIKSETGEGIPVPARSSVPVLLSTLSTQDEPNVTVHVTTRTGRIGAAVSAADTAGGSDWLAASADAAGRQVLPGIPADATDVRLVAFSTGDDDADLKVQLAGSDGTFTPAGAESLHVKSKMTAALDLSDVTKGEAGTLIVSPSGGGRGAPVVAALRVVRGKGDKREIAFIPATGAIASRATVADNRAKGSTLYLTAPGATAKVKVTASAGSGGGEATVKTYTVKAGTTLGVEPEVPAGLKGAYALTVEPESGGPVHAARMLSLPEDGVQMFTVQTLPDDRGTVSVPEAREDLSILEGK